MTKMRFFCCDLIQQQSQPTLMDNYFDPRRKNQQFRTKIRRGQIDNVFAQQRQYLLEQFSNSRHFEIVQKIKSSLEAQNQFLDQCSLSLTGEPSLSWIPIIDNLKASTLAFNGEFDYWFTKSIIFHLTTALKESQNTSKLIPHICTLFSDMVYLSWENETNFSQRLMEYEIMEFVVEQGLNKNYSLRDRIQILRFCGNMCQYSFRYRLKFVRESGAIWICQLATEIIQNEIVQNYILFYYLLAARSVIRYNPKPHQYQLPNLNIIHQMIPIIATIINNQNLSDQNLSNAIQNLTEMMKYDNMSIYRSIFGFNKLMGHVTNAITSQHQELRYNAMDMIGTLTYTDLPQVPVNLIFTFQLLDKMHQSYHMPPCKKSSKFGTICCTILNNLAQASNKVAISIYEHPVFSIVIEELQHTITKNRIEAFYCVNTMVPHLNFPCFQHLLYSHDILHILILGLKEFLQLNGETAIDIIGCLSSIIRKSQKVFTKNGNQVIQILENKYNFTHLLQDIIQNTRNPLLKQLADEIHSQISEIFMDSYPSTL